MKNKFIIILFVQLIVACGSSAQTVNTVMLDSLFQVLAEKDKAMVSVAISKNNQILYQKAIGFASISEKGNVPATPQTRYRIGSVTKTFTATMIFQLIDEGKLTLSQTLKSYFPGVANSEKITIANLLNHRSGIHNFTADPEILQYITLPKTSAQMVGIIAKAKPDFEPGTKTVYSNSNFVLLGYIIEKLTGKTYAQNLDQRIVSKLKLKATYYGAKTDLKKNESYSYKMMGKWIQQPESDMSIPAGAGAIVSTPAELNQFITALFAGKLVKPGSLEQMKTLTDGMGMGLFSIPFGSKKGFGHNGIIDGFMSNMYYFSEDNLAVSICSNGLSYPINDILVALLSSYYNVPFKIPVFKSISIKPEELDKYVGIYSSASFPLKITIAKTESGLTGQATGQGAFPLTPTEADVFEFDQAGITMEFRPAKNEFTFKQGAGTFVFTKVN